MLSKLSIYPKKIFIWNHDNLTESRKKINHKLYFSTNPILNKSEIKKAIRKIKGPETKKKISALKGKPIKPVNWVTRVNT